MSFYRAMEAPSLGEVMSHVIEMIGIRKEFPGIVANDDITLQVEEGEIHAILGENGAGKSTLMSILFGLYHADKGIIKVRGKQVDITRRVRMMPSIWESEWCISISSLFIILQSPRTSY